MCISLLSYVIDFKEFFLLNDFVKWRIFVVGEIFVFFRSPF